MSEIGHNSDTTYHVTADELRQFIERWEALEVEKKEVAVQQREVMGEAKARGYDLPTLRKVIGIRKKDTADLAEQQAVLAMYCEALGMESVFA